ncbi:reverse transcriptase domain-containing protein [Caerostris extrusa]|uniref:Reverse transcriptase domain-containing protein n=1 Tax=Caerostris extrusa TaxID=172846 RepID=A0AAV4XRN3_CAEEX|nr:reverse transcriptase domain-containing protein [Caerostris extrusa]
MEKAYDRAWRYGILRDLHAMGFRGNLPIFIQNFLKTRTFNVRIEQLPPYVTGSLFVDDLQISCSSVNMALIERQLRKQ